MNTPGKKKKISSSRKEELRASLIPLAEACPVDGCNPEDCPLYKVRKMAQSMRLKWFRALTEDDLVFLATYHHVCFSHKLAQKLSERV